MQHVTARHLLNFDSPTFARLFASAIRTTLDGRPVSIPTREFQVMCCWLALFCFVSPRNTARAPTHSVYSTTVQYCTVLYWSYRRPRVLRPCVLTHF